MTQDDKDMIRGGCIVAVLVGVMAPFIFGGCYGLSKVQVSDGYRDSTVRKLSETGVIWKTWEVETLGDGMRATSGEGGTTISPETFRYSVSDPAVLAQLRELPPGKRVRVHYRKQLAAWRPNGESQYFVTRIEELK